MTATEISGFLSSGPGVEASEKLVLTIVKGIYGETEKFNSRPVPECPIVFLDGTWLPIRRRHSGGPDRHEKECAMVALGITKQGRKEVLGFWISANESSSGWEGCLKSLRERGVGSHWLFVTDGLQGMPEAISRVFPGALHQRCLVNIGRNMSRGARREDRQGILDGFSEVYSAPDTAEAERRLRLFVEKWAPTTLSSSNTSASRGCFPSTVSQSPDGEAFTPPTRSRPSVPA